MGDEIQLQHGMTAKIKPTLLLLLCLLPLLTHSFTFGQLKVTASSYITNATASYTVLYEHFWDPIFLNNTAWATTVLTPTDTATLTFPNQYTLSTSITCTYSINSTGVYTNIACGLVGNVITLSGIFNNVVVHTLTVIVNGVSNPYPAGVTSVFSGTIGPDSSQVTGSNIHSTITITPALSACSFTFSPNFVYTSPTNLIMTLTTVNSFPATGTIGLQFPTSRRWSQQLVTTRTFPINTSMACSNQSANVNSGVQCTGDIINSLVTVSNVRSAVLAAGSTIMFSVNNFISPPTNQPVDPVTVTTYTSTGASIDQCTAYVSGLVPKVIPSTQVSIAESSGNPIVVNNVYSIRIDITTLDILSATDYMTITIPTGTSLTSFTGFVSSPHAYNSTTTTYAAPTITVYFTGTSTLIVGTKIFIIQNFVAPASTAQPSTFSIAFYSNTGYPKMTASQSITVTAATLASGSTATPTLSTVNQVTSYTFRITTTYGLTSSGSLKLAFPAVLGVANNANCAAVSGTNMAAGPTCTYSSLDNSITFSNINSSATAVGKQTFTLTVSGITNPPSTLTTGTFALTTFYSSAGGMVQTGTIPGVTASAASIDPNTAVVFASSRVNSANAVSYSLSFVIANPIPVGGYIIVHFPLAITFNVAAASSACQLSLNSSTATSTTCTAVLSTSYIFNFTNPFPASSASATTNITVTIAGVATNPASTQPFQPFSIYTYHSNGAVIASLVNALTYSMTTASGFSSFSVGRVGNTNAGLTSYTVDLTQVGALEAGGVVSVTFPSNAVPQSNSTCRMTVNNVSSAVACSVSGQVFTVTSVSSAITAGTPYSITFTNIRNPLSFSALTGFSATTKTANNLYTYSTGTSSTSLQNSVATPFKAITYSYSPRQFNASVSLTLSFELSQYTLMPTYLLLSIDTYFTVSTLTCSAFANFVGTCSNVSTHTLRIDGTFNNSVMGLTVGGFSSPNAAPSGSTYTTLASFDVNAGKIDQNLTTISFTTICTLPCKTCSVANTSACLSCYSNTNISNSIYFYATLSNCYTTCPATTYNNGTTLTCQPCDANCLNCQGSPTFCTACVANSTFPYLNKTSTTVHVCVANCTSGFYPDTTVSPTTCTVCVSPCATCTTQTSCITCTTGFFLNPTANNTCTSTCPAGTTIANNATNTCDACSSVCLTCSVSVSNCTACSSPAVFYNGSCQASCPSGGTLAPLNGICTACDATCLQCSNTITNCTSCNLSSINLFLVNNTCLTACPQTFYNVSLTGSCVTCASANINCVNCSSASTCLTCDTGFVFLNSQCLSTVPAGYVNISGIAQPCTYPCLTCSISQTNCTACSTNSTLALENNLCVATCPTGKVAVNQVCLACTPNCSTCVNNQTTCTSCLAGLTPQVYLTNNICQQNCPNFTYPNDTTLKCQSCVSPCSLCSSSTTCLSCNSTTFLQGTNCVTVCATGFTGVSGLCQACTANCKTCSGSTSHCLTCNNGTYFLSSSNTCVTTCQPTMFIDPVNQICVGCTSPCLNCVNSSSTCTSCVGGYYFLANSSQCLTACPSGMFIQSNTTCLSCSNNCTTCTSATVCTLCSGLTYLYNGACIANCPATAAVVINGQCTACSTQNCYSCSAADVCLICKSSFLFLNTACLTACPANYTSNGTDCIFTPNQTVITAVSTPSTFPVPFTIAGAVVIVACLMSKLQYAQTFLSGAIYSFFGLLQLLALIYFLFLYYLDYFTTEPTAFYLGLAAIGFLYFLNIVGSVAQPVFLCYQKEFIMWKDQSGFHKCFYGFVNILSTMFSHKIRNVLFCKLFTFRVFSAKLDHVNHFRIFNVFSLLSLGHSAAAIFAAGIALTYIDSTFQLYYQAIDVVILHGINVFMAFFNTHKQATFFQEITPQGLSLHKRNTLDEDFFPNKIKVQGYDGQVQEGFMKDYSHALQSKAALRFQDSDDVYSSSMENISQSKEEQTEKEYEEISVQALDMIDEKVNVTAKTANKSMEKPVCQQISVQAGELISQKQDKGFDLSDLPPQDFPNDSSNFTSANPYFPKVDISVQGNLDRGVNHSVQMSHHPNDVSVQKSYTKHQDVSIQPTQKYNDRSVAVSYNNRSFGIQEGVSVQEEGNQFSVDKQDYELQYGADMLDEGIQPTISYNDAEVQPTLTVSKEQIAIQYQNQLQYDQFQSDLHNSNTATNVIFDQMQQQQQPRTIQRNLQEEKVQALVLQPQNVKSYQQQLQDRIRQKQKELNQVKRKIMMKQRMNEKRHEELEKYPVQEQKIELRGVRYVEHNKPSVRPVGQSGQQNKNRTESQEQKLPYTGYHQNRSQPSQLGLQSKQFPKRQQTIEQIQAGRQDRSSINNKTIEEIQIRQKPTPTVVQKNKVSPKPEQKTPGRIRTPSQKIQYKQVDRSLSSQEEPPGANPFIRSNVVQPQVQPVQSQQNTKKEFIEYEKFQDDELEQSVNKKQSEATKKQFKNRRNVKVDVIQVDHSLGDEIDSSSLESDIQPTNLIVHNEHRPKVISKSPPHSDLSGTIEQIPKHYNKVDNDRTISNSSVKGYNKQPKRQKQMPTSKLQQKDVFDYYSGQINNAMQVQSHRNKDIPKDNQSDKYNIGRMKPRERQEEPMPAKVSHPIGRGGSTFAMAGRAQFTDEMAKKKQKDQRRPLDTKQKWQAKHQQKQVSFQEPRPTNNRQNLVRNKNLQNFASHLVLPQQSDKQVTSFQNAIHKKQKQDKPVSENKIQFQRPPSKRDLDQIQVHFQAEQYSNELSNRFVNQAPNIPRTGTAYNNRQHMPSQANSDYYNEYEDDGEEQIDVRGMMLMNQMQQRPNNEDLQEYYRRKNSKDKGGRRSNNKVGKSTEKIYMQRLDKKR